MASIKVNAFFKHSICNTKFLTKNLLVLPIFGTKAKTYKAYARHNTPIGETVVTDNNIAIGQSVGRLYGQNGLMVLLHSLVI